MFPNIKVPLCQVRSSGSLSRIRARTTSDLTGLGTLGTLILGNVGVSYRGYIGIMEIG